MHETPMPDDKKKSAEPTARSLRHAGTKKHRKFVKRQRFLGQFCKGGLAAEIGVWRGEFSRQILDIIEPDQLCLIDPWLSLESHDPKAFSGRLCDTEMEAVYRSVTHLYQDEIASGLVRVMRELSQTAIPKFEDESISFVYVDGDHSLDGIRTDLELLMPKVAVKGIIALDDYHLRGWWGDGVIRGVNEFLGRYPGHLRVHSVIGAQIAVQKMAPID